jgi:hypothetical protein
MKKISHLIVAAMALTAGSLMAAETSNPFVGNWALTIPGGGAGWLGVTQEKGYYDASVLWGGGSVVPTASVFFYDNRIHVMRLNEVKRKDASGKVVRTQQYPEVLIGELSGDEIQFKQFVASQNGDGMSEKEFSGKRIPPLPPKPDLSQVKFGDPITLFNGKNLDGWKLTSSGQKSGWSVKDGVMVNNPEQPRDKSKHISYGNLRTVAEFEDFQLTLETRVAKNGNSGIYLRGIYEVQVADTYGKPLDSHNMGGIYSRITPLKNAEKPAGEWQSYKITLVNRHVTVVLNGETIIDNAPLLGCTGGALWSDQFRPGPIYLQGDHTGIEYRNISLKPVVK